MIICNKEIYFALRTRVYIHILRCSKKKSGKKIRIPSSRAFGPRDVSMEVIKSTWGLSWPSSGWDSASITGPMSLIPGGQGTRLLHAMWHGQNIKIKKKCLKTFWNYMQNYYVNIHMYISQAKVFIASIRIPMITPKFENSL